MAGERYLTAANPICREYRSLARSTGRITDPLADLY
jgi:hypothetical protein